MPLISVCIPVFRTEKYLERCLSSVARQHDTFSDFEVILVSDASDGTASLEGGRPLSCKKLAKTLAGKYGLNLTYIEHRKNRGLVEVRRTAVTKASGTYILHLDSDDLLAPGALKALYDAAVSTGADIVHGHTTAIRIHDRAMYALTPNLYGNQYPGVLEGNNVHFGWLAGYFTGALWGKLYRREQCLEAYEHIPYTETNLGEDLLFFFFLSHIAQKYVSISENVYYYVYQDGMTAQKEITDLEKWRMHCSAASAITILVQWSKETENVPDAVLHNIKASSRHYLKRSIELLNTKVVPELREEARALLCEYWGEDFVSYMETHPEA